MDFDPQLKFSGYISIPILAHPLYGSNIFFSSKEEFDSALLNLHYIPNVNYRGSPEHLTYLRARQHTTFIPSSSNDEISFSSTATIKNIDLLDSDHPNRVGNVRQATKDLTLPHIVLNVHVGLVS
jgi:hypothetical protein